MITILELNSVVIYDIMIFNSDFNLGDCGSGGGVVWESVEGWEVWNCGGAQRSDGCVQSWTRVERRSGGVQRIERWELWRIMEEVV